ncbi:unnamed protein product [Cylindrotheca closterium]|uniref:Uncharacterized protein n=1 Tax=Cylindrotheca closterium TaxID=2856 RepID=A0AAD2G282_9STRA|nr:unnamed protein product [Cylindrotheca closterium]CAJ1959968.1 unnamed protein product [Cylindrotheca closterium]
MSPFLVDYSGQVIDLGRLSGDESIDESHVMEIATSGTDSETDVLLHDDDEDHDHDHDHHHDHDHDHDGMEGPQQHPKSPVADNTMRTELESLSSSVSSEKSETEGKPRQQQQQQQTQQNSTTTDLSSTTPLSPPRKIVVKFSQIQIREYPMIVGDNPSALTGVPVTIDWEHVDELEFQLEDYESGRPQPPRSMVQLRMPASHRDGILKSQGFSLAERNHGKKMANVTKGRRRRTSETMKLSHVAETAEIWKRATKNATWGRKQKQKEREYLHPYVEH